MYLSNIKIWNFRKYGPSAFPFPEKPNLDLTFNKGLNTLIGANDSGKTAILDAIKLVLKTNTGDWIKVNKAEDFYQDTNNIKIQLRFDNFETDEARNFAEFLCVDTTIPTNPKEYLILSCEISKNTDRVFPFDIKAGPNGSLGILTAEQREYLNVTYLKPLRDVKTEFIPKKGSRLSTILESHEAFKGKNKTHDLYKEFENLNEKIKDYFTSGLNGDLLGIEIKETIKQLIGEFIDDSKGVNFNVSDGDLKDILEKLKLTLENNINPGLGSLNRLFIASELLHLQRKDYDGLELGIIEEIEAHIHPQAQMKVIESLQNKIKDTKTQLIITTHSPNLASKVRLENLIICDGGNAFPMGENYTKLAKEDYRFLERFLDVTKSNLFFSKGVILVEGWAEEIILPTFTRLLKALKVFGDESKDLTQSEVSIVNVGSDTFFRYAKIFERIEEPFMEKRIAILTDIDLRPDEYRNYPNIKEKLDLETNPDEIKKILKSKNIISGFTDEEITIARENKTIENIEQNIKTFLTDDDKWTLEYSIGLFPKFQKFLFESVKKSIVEMRSNGTYNYGEETRDFSSITGDDKEKSFKIYNGILLKKKVSKTIVAQHFSEFLEEEIIKIEKGEPSIFQKSDFENVSSISYIVNAIKHATKQ